MKPNRVPPSKIIHIGLLGYGNVGKGFLGLLSQHQDFIREKTGVLVHIKKILVKNRRKKRDISPALKIRLLKIFSTSFLNY